MQLSDYRDSILKDAFKLISVPSVHKPEPGYPASKNAVECLHVALDMLKGMGFTTYADPEGYYGYADIGEGPLFGVLGHLDVVPAQKDDGWVSDPFKPEIRDGKVYGRGILDDKGPVVIMAYALKALLDEGRKLNHRVRFILGLAEETTWDCINHYVAKEEMPEMSITPDSAFPFVFAEKGLMQLELTSKVPASMNFRGGTSMNAVAGNAFIAPDADIEARLKANDFAYKLVDGEIKVEGQSAHAKIPWAGCNAIWRLVKCIKETGKSDPGLDFMMDCLVEKPRFEGFTDEKLDDFSGPVSVNLGMARGDEKGTWIGLDLRLPVTLDRQKVLDLVQAKADRYGLEMKMVDWLRPVYLPLDSPLATALTNAYQSVTGDTETKPAMSGGATYARGVDNCVAFGPNFPGEPCTEHMPNEYMTLDNIMKALEIYYTALKALVFA